MNCSELVYVGLGSNLGNSREYLNDALWNLDRVLDKIRISSLYQTEPQGYINQPCFYNCAACGYYQGTAESLLDYLHALEQLSGRVRNIPNGPRTLDLDILLFGDLFVQTSRLAIPHPRIKERAFVLFPLLELTPDLKDPHSGESYGNCLESVRNQGVYCLGAL